MTQHWQNCLTEKTRLLLLSMWVDIEQWTALCWTVDELGESSSLRLKSRKSSGPTLCKPKSGWDTETDSRLTDT